MNDKNVFVNHFVNDKTNKNDKNVFVSHSVNDIDNIDDINDCSSFLPEMERFNFFT